MNGLKKQTNYMLPNKKAGSRAGFLRNVKLNYLAAAASRSFTSLITSSETFLGAGM